MTKVFISYSRKDLNFVDELASDLKDVGINVWYDLSRLEGGDQWADEIQNAINACDEFILVISPSSIKSKWVFKEFLYASNAGKRIVPLLYKKCSLPLWLQDIHFIDVQGKKYGRNFYQIVRTLGIKLAIQPKREKKQAKEKTELPSLAKIDASFRKKIQKYAPFFLFIAIAFFVAFTLPSWLSQAKPSPQATPTQTQKVIPTATEKLIVESSATPTPSKTVLPEKTPTKTLTPTDTPFPEEILDIDLAGNEIPMRFVPEGEFTMGSDTGEKDEAPEHLVYLNDYYIDAFEVTTFLYKSCIEEGVCQIPEQTYNGAFSQSPVVFVSWDMAQQYCEWRDARLPTEAEWEKAARGIDSRLYPWGNEDNCQMANYDSCFGNIREVGYDQYVPSPYGVYDMSGNVWEWVSDWYDESYYLWSPYENPKGPLSGNRHILRGGSWESNGDNVRVVERSPADREINYKYGFRCAKDAP